MEIEYHFSIIECNYKIKIMKAKQEQKQKQTSVILRVADLKLQKAVAAAFSQRSRERILREGVL